MADPEIPGPPEPSISPISSSPPPALPPAPPKYTIFRGPNGIRAGWRALIFVAILAALLVTLRILLRLIFHGAHVGRMAQLTPLQLSISEGSIFLLTSIAALIMARIEHRKWAQYGLPGRSAFGKHFWVGIAVGFVSISACLLAIFALHGFQLAGIATHGKALVGAVIGWSITFVFVGLAEEFSFRGYLQYTLTTGIGFWPSAIVLSLLFGFAHSGNPGESKFGLVSVVLFALLFCLFLRRTGNLWWAVGFHAGWDWGQTFFYGVPDSGLLPYHSLFACKFSGPAWLTGGTVGPEASVFTPIVLLIVAVLFARAYRENNYQAEFRALRAGFSTQA
jgi:uncharacterized protein